jgi:hypothetical protein
MIENVILKPEVFWKEIDLMLENVREWVLANCGDADYQCCGKASDILYRLFIDWGLEKYKDEGLEVYIVIGHIRGIHHHWVEISEFVFDPTAMQFDDPEPTIEEYSEGVLYIEEDFNAILRSEEILDICRSIRPDIYKE